MQFTDKKPRKSSLHNFFASMCDCAHCAQRPLNSTETSVRMLHISEIIRRRSNAVFSRASDLLLPTLIFLWYRIARRPERFYRGIEVLKYEEMLTLQKEPQSYLALSLRLVRAKPRTLSHIYRLWTKISSLIQRRKIVVKIFWKEFTICRWAGASLVAL